LGVSQRRSTGSHEAISYASAGNRTPRNTNECAKLLSVPANSNRYSELLNLFLREGSRIRPTIKSALPEDEIGASYNIVT
jgi:hypothetical protein